MGLHVRFIEDKLSGNDYCIYSPKELALECHPATGLPEQCFYAIADTLTMVFDAETQVLVGFDAYANYARWKLSSVQIPEAHGEGRIEICDALTDDRVSLGVSPIYEYSSKEKTLRIVIGNARCTRHYFVGRNLLVGITESDCVGQFVVANLRIAEFVNDFEAL